MTTNGEIPTKALNWPEGGVPNPSEEEKQYKSIPVVGKLLGGYGANKRLGKVEDYINKQLSERSEITDAKNSSSGLKVCKLIKKHMGWTNDRYILDDPLEILLWSHIDGLDAKSLTIEIEDSCNVELSDDVMLNLIKVGKLRDLITFISPPNKTV